MRALSKYAPTLLRLAIGLYLLSSIADRTGLLGSAHSKMTRWGDFNAYIKELYGYFPYFNKLAIKVLAWSFTFIEVLTGILLVVRIKTQASSFAIAFICLATGISITVTSGVVGLKEASDGMWFILFAAALMLGTVTE